MTNCAAMGDYSVLPCSLFLREIFLCFFLFFFSLLFFFFCRFWGSLEGGVEGIGFFPVKACRFFFIGFLLGFSRNKKYLHHIFGFRENRISYLCCLQAKRTMCNHCVNRFFLLTYFLLFFFSWYLVIYSAVITGIFSFFFGLIFSFGTWRQNRYSSYPVISNV